jgi:glycolate oxidase iron-sulfur subunit
MDTIRGLLLGDLRLTPRMEEILSSCLMCQACETSCPPGVVTQRLILEARHRALSKRGLPLAKRLAFRRLLKDRRALRRALRVARAIQALGPKPERGPLRHLPTLFSGLAGGRALPPLADHPLRERIPQATPPRRCTEPRGRVALFSGCYMEFVATPMGEAGVRVLASQGYEVVFPQGQVCCGAPVLFSGDLEDSMELARRNAEAFRDGALEAVVTLCATCGSTLREGYKILAGHLEGEERERVLALTAKVQDITSLLASRPLAGPLTLPQPMTVTYHDPCHHVRAQKISAAPRELLRSIQGVTLLEMKEPAKCCGGGGSFSLTHAEVSLEVGSWKVQDILSTGAQAVVTACPGCILQIQEVAGRKSAPLQVLHLVELLDRALLYP